MVFIFIAKSTWFEIRFTICITFFFDNTLPVYQWMNAFLENITLNFSDIVSQIYAIPVLFAIKVADLWYPKWGALTTELQILLGTHAK